MSSFLDYLDPNNENCKLPRCKKAAGIYKIIVLVIGFILLYNIVLIIAWGSKADVVTKDPLNRTLFKIPVFDCNFSGWPLTHFLCFFILGLLFPDEDLFVVGGGILWEIFESTCFLCTGRTEHKKVCGRDNIEYTSWWNGSFQDIIFNTLGFYAGKLIVKASGKKICFPWVNEYSDWCGGCETKEIEEIKENANYETNVNAIESDKNSGS
ncbi:hypothetical protein DRO61_02765 [Candidatus Bathyarchaeota archaeon]|nr:MAG: hypothetical protein DRO61_02765 [Candidatus Bathyarchaeota archaeon]